MADDAREVSDSSPPPPREQGSEEGFAPVPLDDEAGCRGGAVGSGDGYQHACDAVRAVARRRGGGRGHPECPLTPRRRLCGR
ncbi:hypothetical protein PR202_gb14744 [Eleusine coracana subsp. coracana]|uniref:Uncharacterized protein n=1 Tax=Eleusine coracana subsp. coracana TaxID=191504 RepID=A0AAV5ETX9_ELECO|nr:hypothetical protein PR202_gb14744 [Eleusine coracana subsp. coracana]